MSDEKKLTDEEIIHDLEEFAKDMEYGAIYKNALDLIHRLQDENKALKSDKRRVSWKIKFFNTLEEHKQFVELAKKVDTEQKTEIERLRGEIDQRRGMMSRMDCNYATELQKNAELQKQVDELKKRLHWIWAIGVDYDGCDKAESLKKLIDEMVDITQMEIKDFNKHYGVEVE